MGIKNGAPKIITIVRRGLYNKRAKNYKIVIDGELMRYKGMVENNLNKHDAEEAIAGLSFNYMKNLVDQVSTFIGYRPKEVIVFMDGARVCNKESDRADFQFDAGLIRLTFKGLCYSYGYTVNELTHGESELQMYLQRDKTVELNVFITNDSDMISICYGHKPTLEHRTPNNAVDSIFEPQSSNSTTGTTCPIIDLNCVYNPEKVKVLDSCVWINSGKIITAVGFDFIEDRIKFNTFVFRTFVSFCGTDFTSNLLTDSMVVGILLSEEEDIEVLNTLTDINDIACGLLMLGLRAGGTIKRFDDNAKSQMFLSTDVDQATRMYLRYINSGVMENVPIPRPNMSLGTRHYLYAARNQESSFVKKNLVHWAKSTPLLYGIENMRLHLGTFDPATCDDKKPTKRKLLDEDEALESKIMSKIKVQISTSSESAILAPFTPQPSSHFKKTVLDEL
nr:polh/gran [Oryctes rhinoceros nudivirus]